MTLPSRSSNVRVMFNIGAMFKLLVALVIVAYVAGKVHKEDESSTFRDSKVFCSDHKYCGPGFHCCDVANCCPESRACCWPMGNTKCCKDPVWPWDLNKDYNDPSPANVQLL
uniref:Cysteine rich secreted protein n=1 Tax=Riptortus pedestris TaxID=329032 RepID=R4WQV2_RIPPE|nr:cysteine rich secreted protein [Riptortus pedestris]